jgi:hypothetical protein
MLLKDLPTKRKEVILYKIQVQEILCWKELTKAHNSLEDAIKKLPDRQESRIVKRTDKGWEIVWSSK